MNAADGRPNGELRPFEENDDFIPLRPDLESQQAARAALLRGDRFGTVRLLKEAIETADPAFPPLTEVWAVREASIQPLERG